MVQMARAIRSMDGKKCVCLRCAQNRVCHIWWHDYLDEPVWMCSSCIASVRRQKQAQKRAEIKERLRNGSTNQR